MTTEQLLKFAVIVGVVNLIVLFIAIIIMVISLTQIRWDLGDVMMKIHLLTREDLNKWFDSIDSEGEKQMKKKVKELTEEEQEKICHAHSCYDGKCPLCIWSYEQASPICIKDYFDKEVEVEE